MDTRLLYISAVVVGALSGAYYYYSGKSQKLDVDSAHSMIQSADDIQLLQTDDSGKLNLRGQVDHMEQNLQSKTSQAKSIKVSLYKNDVVDATFIANQAKGFDDNAKVILSGAVRATKAGPNGDMVFLTDQLTGFPPLGTLETDQTVRVYSPDAEFVSKGLKADMNTGQYEFFNIRGKYVPN